MLTVLMAGDKLQVEAGSVIEMVASTPDRMLVRVHGTAEILARGEAKAGEPDDAAEEPAILPMVPAAWGMC